MTDVEARVGGKSKAVVRQVGADTFKAVAHEYAQVVRDDGVVVATVRPGMFVYTVADQLKNESHHTCMDQKPLLPVFYVRDIVTRVGAPVDLMIVVPCQRVDEFTTKLLTHRKLNPTDLVIGHEAFLAPLDSVLAHMPAIIGPGDPTTSYDGHRRVSHMAPDVDDLFDWPDPATTGKLKVLGPKAEVLQPAPDVVEFWWSHDLPPPPPPVVDDEEEAEEEEVDSWNLEPTSPTFRRGDPDESVPNGTTTKKRASLAKTPAKKRGRSHSPLQRLAAEALRDADGEVATTSSRPPVTSNRPPVATAGRPTPSRPPPTSRQLEVAASRTMPQITEEMVRKHLPPMPPVFKTPAAPTHADSVADTSLRNRSSTPPPLAGARPPVVELAVPTLASDLFGPADLHVSPPPRMETPYEKMMQSPAHQLLVHSRKTQTFEKEKRAPRQPPVGQQSLPREPVVTPGPVAVQESPPVVHIPPVPPQPSSQQMPVQPPVVQQPPMSQQPPVLQQPLPQQQSRSSVATTDLPLRHTGSLANGQSLSHTRRPPSPTTVAPGVLPMQPSNHTDPPPVPDLRTSELTVVEQVDPRDLEVYKPQLTDFIKQLLVAENNPLEEEFRTNVAVCKNFVARHRAQCGGEFGEFVDSVVLAMSNRPQLVRFTSRFSPPLNYIAYTMFVRPVVLDYLRALALSSYCGVNPLPVAILDQAFEERKQRNSPRPQ